MKIDDVLQKVLSLRQNEGPDKKNETDRKTSKIQISASEDTVAISSMIQRLTTEMSCDEVGSMRMDRVITLKNLIQSGEYNVSGRDVAEKMLAMMNKKG
jgi:flagellar biosynthesis anti-sigma factor FlgM